MTNRFRYVAPAGAPIGGADLAAWTRRLLSSEDHLLAARDAVRSRLGVRHCFLFGTGRAGLAVLLRAIRRLEPGNRDEVVIPAYTCYTVAAAVVRAGLRPRIVDVDPQTLDFDPQALDATPFDRVLAIVPTNLFGIPSDLPRLTRIAAPLGVSVIDDAAQAMGARVGGRLSGTWGRAGLYSLDKGKNITAIEGGIVVTDDDMLADVIAGELRTLPPPRRSAVARDAVKMIAYAVLLRPWLYWAPNAIPQLKLGITAYDPHIVLERYNRVSAAMVLSMIRRLEAFNAHRCRIAAALAAALKTCGGVAHVRPPADAEPVYLRYPVLVRESSARDRLVAALTERGIGATGSYPACLADVPALQPHLADTSSRCPGARAVAARIMTLPTHPFVRDSDIETMREAVTVLTPMSMATATPGVAVQ
jgi:dTDP-4-amino-4,6-dideoxygalactose transaminase